MARRLEQLTRVIPVTFPNGAAICQPYATQVTRLRDAGTPIGANDHWIGRHALAESAIRKALFAGSPRRGSSQHHGGIVSAECRRLRDGPVERRVGRAAGEVKRADRVVQVHAAMDPLVAKR
jgi:hypothetical protein